MSVNMSKGQRISLEKQGGGELTKVRMGLGWDAIEQEGPVRPQEGRRTSTSTPPA